MPATKRKFAAPLGLLINSSSTVDSSVASTSPSTGAFVISGGAGIGDTVNVKGHINLWNNPNTFYTGLRAGTLTTSTYYILPSNFPGTGTSILQSDISGTLSWVPMTVGASSGATSANINVVGAGSSNLAHSILFTPIASSSGSAVSSDTTLSFNPSTEILSVSGLAVTAATGSSNTTTGAFVVTGGVGIGGSLNVNNKTRFNDEVYINSISNNALYITGSGSVAYTWSVGTTLSSNRFNLGQDLCLVPVGGSQSVLQSFWGLQLAGNTQLNATSYTASAVGANNAFGVLIPNQQAASVGLAVIAHASQTGDLQIWTTPSGLATTTYLAVKSNGQLYSYASIASTNTSTGALVVTGGVGIGQSVSVGGRLQMFNGANYTAFVSSASGNTVYTLPATSPATGSSVLQSDTAGVMSWVPMVAGASSGNTSQNIVVNAAGNANVFHPVLFTPSSLSAGSAVSSDSTITFNPSTEILNVSGLAITAGTASTNNVTGALVVRGGLGVSGQLSFVSASMGFTGITYNPTMAFIGATSSSPITLTVLTDNSLNWEGSQGSVFSIDSNLSTGEIFSVSDISGLPIISASAGQTVIINEFGGFTRIGNGSISSTGASNSAANGSLVVYGGVGVTGELSVGGKLQIFNGTKYAAFVSSSTGNTIYTLPPTSPAVGTSYLTSNSSGVMSWTAPNKANYVLSFGAGFTPTADSADSVSLNVPYLPDGTLKYYYIKRIEYRNETLSGGTGLSFYLQRHTTGNASWNTTNTITAGSGASFYIGPSVYASSFTTIASSAGVAGSVVSGDYLRLFFTGVGSAANLSIAMTIEEQ